ncbi:alpha/beta fold hydrolase [Steroidobacter flavus]|uniref:Alpha/beta fold hydrolase n=1 Tax=Steroidobacter flavus TaxID=1842136 RepID=A0ABV8SMX3_9GAMM
MVCVLALAGCSSAPPPPGQKVDIGGLALHVNCTGPSTAQPTVIIEAGLGEMSASYHWVQAGVSKQARVCSYDRAGLGWSDSSSDPRDAQHMVRDLHALLEAAHISPPYVLAGHSLGGLLILAYTRRYPDEVAGLVFLDSSHPQQKARLPDYERNERWGKRMLTALSIGAHLGLTGLLTSSSDEPSSGEPPADVRAAFEYFGGDPRMYSTGRAELDRFDADTADAALVDSLGDRPVVVITAGKLRKHSNPKELADAEAYVKIFSELHAQYAALSSRGRQVILPNAGHMSLVYDKSNADDVVRNILEVVQEVRSLNQSQ